MKPDIDKILSSSALEAAPQLLGWIVCRQLPEGVVKLRIVETEAYRQDDPASHTFAGLTRRTESMFKRGGHIYVFFTYGMHYALNIVTGKTGVGEAVLIRAGEPLEGIEIMQKNRGLKDVRNLASGPGKLAQALGIGDTKLSGEILNKSSIWLEAPEKPHSSEDIITTTRIGIKQAADLPWRFYIKDNPFVSRL